MWPEKLKKILAHYYFNIQEKNIRKILTLVQKEELVSELISAYNSLSSMEKLDVLIPARAEFVEDRAIKADKVGSKKYRYEVNYKWPPNDGFRGACKRITLIPGYEYDRIGSPKGSFIAPITKTGTPLSFLSRAIPYYIPESNIADSPAYHRYRVISQYQGIGLSDKESVLQGIVAHAFWYDPDDGGGTQVKLPKRIKELGAVFDEVEIT